MAPEPHEFDTRVLRPFKRVSVSSFPMILEVKQIEIFEASQIAVIRCESLEVRFPVQERSGEKQSLLEAVTYGGETRSQIYAK